MTSWQDPLDAAIERYVGLESIEAMEELLTVCGATIDTRALPLLTRRLTEEETQRAALAARGYTRMAEKSAQLAASLRALMQTLEGW